MNRCSTFKLFILLILFCVANFYIYGIFNGPSLQLLWRKELLLCPLVPPHLNGPLKTFQETLEFAKIAELNPGLQKGGLFSPHDCRSRHRVAIVIPYRNREEHLKIFLHNLHPFLMRQQLDYGIYVIDQALPGRFNRAMLMNIGYVEAMK